MIIENVYVIGPMSRSKEIKEHAKWKATITGLNVKYTDPYSLESLEFLISKAFDNIEKADLIEVVKKEDGTIGDGTLYEMEYAIRLGKIVRILDI